MQCRVTPSAANVGKCPRNNSEQTRMQKASVKKSGAGRQGGEPQRPAQYRFLTELAKDGRPVAIFLVNGLKLEGRIVSFDDYAILLEGDLSDHVYKHAISTIQPLTAAMAKGNGGGKSHARSSAGRPPLKRVEPALAESVEEHKPRQPTIVVRAKRRVIKSTPGEG